MACQGRNRRLVRDCPTSIDAQMERKVQRVEGEVMCASGEALMITAQILGAGLVLRGVAWLFKPWVRKLNARESLLSCLLIHFFFIQYVCFLEYFACHVLDMSKMTVGM